MEYPQCNNLPQIRKTVVLPSVNHVPDTETRKKLYMNRPFYSCASKKFSRGRNEGYNSLQKIFFLRNFT